MKEFILHGGMLVDSKEIVPADLWIVGGRIAGWLAPGTGVEMSARRPEVQLVSATGLYILPGLIDVHVHLREPGLEHKEDFATGTEAAALGGVTTVLDMPNTIPPVTNGRILEEKMDLAKGRIAVDVGFYGVVGKNNIASLDEMVDAGAIAFKLFLGPTTGDIEAPSRGSLYDAFQEVADTGLPLVVHAEDREIISHWRDRMQGLGDTYGHFLQSRPPFGEAIATDLAVRLAESAGVRLHVAHVATREVASVVQAAKQRTSLVTCETCPHYLALTQADWPRLGNKLKILPPVRSARDQEHIWDTVRDSTIDIIATDHAPHLEEERKDKVLWDAPAGAAGLETMLPLLLDWVNQGRLTLPDVVRLTAEQPARIFGLNPQKGSLRPGTDADVVLVDMMRHTVIRGDSLHSRCKNTPYEGMEVQGAPVATYVRGELVANQGALVSEKRLGRVLTPRLLSKT